MASLSGKRSKYEIDMCNGTIMDKLISFSLPLMLSGILQLMFNAVDIVVVGRFSGSDALAAVGSTTALINMFVNLFIGISLGVNVLAARFYAAGREKEMSETVHTAIMFALISGIVMSFVGIGCAKIVLQWMDTPDNVIDMSTLYMRITVHTAIMFALISGIVMSFVGIGCAKIVLQWMDTPDNVIDMSTLYMRIYFVGMPFFMLYNYSAAVLRAIGDTKRPLLFLIISGMINAGLNLILVIVFHMGVAGVAIATVIAQFISCVLVLRCLWNAEGSYQLRFSKLTLKSFYLKQIFQVGIPAGIQSVVINFSNVLLQSSVNSFGSIAMAGYTAANNIFGFLYVAVNSVTQACMSFTSQNYGVAKKKRMDRVSIAMAGYTAANNIFGFLYVAVNSVTQACMSFTSQNYGVAKKKRMDRVLIDCVILSVVVALVLGGGAYIFGDKLLRIYTSDSEVVRCGMQILLYTTVTYFMCGLMDLLPGSMRGMGYSLVPMILSIVGTVGMRIVWIYGVFPSHRSLDVLFISYPASWIITILMQVVCFVFVRKKVHKMVGEGND